MNCVDCNQCRADNLHTMLDGRRTNCVREMEKDKTRRKQLLAEGPNLFNFGRYSSMENTPEPGSTDAVVICTHCGKPIDSVAVNPKYADKIKKLSSRIHERESIFVDGDDEIHIVPKEDVVPIDINMGSVGTIKITKLYGPTNAPDLLLTYEHPGKWRLAVMNDEGRPIYSLSLGYDTGLKEFKKALDGGDSDETGLPSVD